MSAFSVRQAAYLMGIRVDTVKEMIKEGKLLVIKSNPNDDDDSPIIHETEISRFQHPWEHIFRLDERANAQQILVEQLKAKVNDALGIAYRSDVEMLRMEVKQLKDTLQYYEPMLEHLAELRETIQGLQKQVEKLSEIKERKFFRRKKE